MERHRVMLGNIDPDLWARVKAEAALAKKPIAKWVEEVLWEAVEDAEDMRDAMESHADTEGTLTLDEVMERYKHGGKLSDRVSAKGAQGPRRPARASKGARAPSYERASA